MATWPTQLPAPQIAGYQLAPEASFARTDMDAGPARQRRRFTAAPTAIDVQLVLTAAQFEIFEAWFERRIESGAQWFSAPIANGQGVSTVDCRFTEPWTAAPLGGGDWQVAAKWETRDRPIMSEAALAALGI